MSEDFEGLIETYYKINYETPSTYIFDNPDSNYKYNLTFYHLPDVISEKIVFKFGVSETKKATGETISKGEKFVYTGVPMKFGSFVDTNFNLYHRFYIRFSEIIRIQNTELNTFKAELSLYYAVRPE
jgi:hypothetical protein